MNEQHEGPVTRRIPQSQEKICHGCKYLKQEAHLRGRFKKTDNYFCKHPKAILLFSPFNAFIHQHKEYPCTTPKWCPFLREKKTGFIIIFSNGDRSSGYYTDRDSLQDAIGRIEKIWHNKIAAIAKVNFYEKQ